jgi:type I restriction enzyme S subunit
MENQQEIKTFTEAELNCFDVKKLKEIIKKNKIKCAFRKKEKLVSIIMKYQNDPKSVELMSAKKTKKKETNEVPDNVVFEVNVLDKYTVKQLRHFCDKHKIRLDSTSKKDKIVQRILEWKKEPHLYSVFEKKFTNYKEPSNNLYYEITEEDKEQFDLNNIENTRQTVNKFVSLFHELLRSSANAGEEARDDIITAVFIKVLDDKIKRDEKKDNKLYDFFNYENYFDKDIIDNDLLEDEPMYILLNTLKSESYKASLVKLLQEYKGKEFKYNKHDIREVTKDVKITLLDTLLEVFKKNKQIKNIFNNSETLFNCKDPNIIKKLFEIMNNEKNTEIVNELISKNDSIGYIYEYFRNKYSSRSANQYFTERMLMFMTFQLFEKSDIQKYITNDSTIGDEFCGTFGYPIHLRDFLIKKYNIKIKKDNMYGVEYTSSLYKLASINSFLSYGKTLKNVKEGNSYITNVSPHIDCSVDNVPFGTSMKYDNLKEIFEYNKNNLPDNLKLEDVIKFGHNNDVILSSQCVVYKTKHMGIMIIKDGNETNSEDTADYRCYMSNVCNIKKILKIPGGSFTHTGVSTVAIYFTKDKPTENIQFLQLSDDTNKITELFSVSMEDLKNNFYSWNPTDYMEQKTEEHLSNCEWKTLGEICEIEYGKRIVKKDYTTGDIPVYGGGGITFKTDKFNRDGNYLKIARFGASPKNFIMNIKGRFYLNDSGLTLKFNLENNYNYFKNYLHKFNNNLDIFNSLYKGGGQKNLECDKLLSIKVPVPSLEVQNEIVDMLDNLSELENSYKTAIEKLPYQKKGILLSHLRLNHSKYEWKTLGKICNIIKGNKINSKLGKQNGLYPLYYCSILGYLYYDEYKFNDTGIIINTTNGSGKCGIYLGNGKYNVGHSTHHFKNENKITTIFVYYYLKLNKHKLLEPLYVGGNQKILNSDKLLSIKVPVPSLEVQNNIVQKLEKIDNEIETYKQKIKSIQEQKNIILESSYKD